VLTAAVVLAALAVALPLGALAVASRAAGQATEEAARDPRAAVADLQHAARLDPLTADPLVTEAVIARRLGDRGLAQRSLLRALEREPDNWFARFELALLDATSGRRPAALRHLGRAQELNPRQPVIGETIRRVRRGATIDPDEIESELDRERNARLHPIGAA
jgi:tetratricopeptide (TPR) repeat protein